MSMNTSVKFCLCVVFLTCLFFHQTTPHEFAEFEYDPQEPKATQKTDAGTKATSLPLFSTEQNHNKVADNLDEQVRFEEFEVTDERPLRFHPRHGRYGQSKSIVDWLSHHKPWGTKEKVALVLAGGGAKGIFAVGALEALCNTSHANSWDMLVGTSIGALNAGMLAQFPKSAQCSQGVPVLKEYWKSIKKPSDVYVSSYLSFHEDCMNPLNAVDIALSWYERGGFCDSSPGVDRYRKGVSAELIHSSGMELFVPASRTDRIDRPAWFNHTSVDIVDGLIASGAISPLLYPVVISGVPYLDGGLFHNLPILKALEKGATTVLAILLTPIEADSVNTFSSLDEVKGSVGGAVLRFYLDAIERQLLLAKELSDACVEYPKAKILGIVPPRDIGKLTDFFEEKLDAMHKYGQEIANTSGLVDLCEAAGIPRDTISLLGGSHSVDSSPKQRKHARIVEYGVVALVCTGLVMLGILIGVLLRARTTNAGARYQDKGNDSYQRWRGVVVPGTFKSHHVTTGNVQVSAIRRSAQL